MSAWEILGIAATDDTDLIKKAYLAKLPEHNPEDDQEGFLRLRAAYDEVLQNLRDQEIPEEEDTSAEGIILKKMAGIYEDFASRINVEIWQGVLDEELCQRLDTQQIIGEKLLNYLMQNNNLPHAVWKLLTEFFCWQEQESTLKDKLPPRFIDYVFNQATYDDTIRYSLFRLESQEDYDELLDSLFSLNSAVNEENREEAERLIEELGDLEHPDFVLLKARFLLPDDLETAQELVETLLEEYPDDIRAKNVLAQCLLKKEDWEGARELFQQVLAEQPLHYYARVGLADTYYLSGDLVTAKEKYWALCTDNPYDSAVADTFFKINEALIPLYEKKIDEDKDDQEYIYKLASCYHNCRRTDDVWDLLRQVTPEPDKRSKHYDLCGYALMDLGMNEEAVEHLREWEKAETDRRRLIRSLPAALLNMGYKEETLAKCDEYLEEFPNEVSLYETKARVYYQEQKYAEALSLCEEGLSRSKELGIVTLRAYILYDMNDMGGALEAADQGLVDFPYVYSLLLLKIKVYHHAWDNEEVLEVCRIFEGSDFHDDQVDLYRSSAELRLGKNEDRAADILVKQLDKDPSQPLAVFDVVDYYIQREELMEALEVLNNAIKEDPDFQGFHMSRARVYRWMEEWDAALGEIERLEEASPDDAEIFIEKGKLLIDMEREDEAKACFEKVIEINPYDEQAYGSLAHVYTRKGDYEQAVELLTKQLEYRKHPYLYISRGYAYSYLGRADLEKEDYLNALELDPDFASAHNNLGIVYYDEDELEKALEHLDKALSLDNDIQAAYQYKGKTLAELGEWEKALQVLEGGIEHFAGDQKAAFILNREKLTILKDRGKYEEGLALKDEFEKIGQLDSYTLRELAYCAYELKQDWAAQALLVKAIVASPTDSDTLRRLGHFYWFAKKNRQKAVASLEKAIAVERTEFRNYIRLAQILVRSAPEEAAELFQQALDILETEGVNTACLCYWRGEALNGLGRLEEAEEAYRQSLTMAENWTVCPVRCCYEALFGLAELYAKKGDRQQALEYYDKTLAVMPDREYVEGRRRFLGEPEEKQGFFAKIWSTLFGK
jgi:tetratricopeptide (TPR) repeat protein